MEQAWSILELLRGILRKFPYWVPFILLDATDYWNRYIRQFILSTLGVDLAMPPNALIVGAILAILWCAFLTYHELRKDKLRLDDQLSAIAEIETMPLLQQWSDAKLGSCRSFYVRVKNPSSILLRGVSVTLSNMKPLVENLDWLPVPLHIKHDNIKPYKVSFDLNHHGQKLVDVISKSESERTITVCHIIEWVNPHIPVGKYLFIVRVEGQNIAIPRETPFLVKVDESGKLICLPGSFSYTEKGIVEFSEGVQKASPRLLASINRLAKDISNITRITTQATEQLNDINQGLSKFGPGVQLYKIKYATNAIAQRLTRATKRLEQSVGIFNGSVYFTQPAVRTHKKVRDIIGGLKACQEVEV